MMGPWSKAWNNLRRATSPHFLRGHIQHGRDDTRHAIRVDAEGRRARRRGALFPRILGWALALSLAAALVALSWRITEGKTTTLRYMVPFALLGFFMAWLSELSMGWKLDFSIMLAAFLLPMIL